METTRTVPDLANLARTYTARAQPVTSAQGNLAEDTEPTEVEVRILTTVHDAVRLRAQSQNQVVADVARAVLFQAAAKVTEGQQRAFRNAQAARVRQSYQRAYERALNRGLSEDEAKIKAQAAADKTSRTRLPLREYLGDEARHRLRFIAPAGPYEEARDAILASGRTVARAVEDGLRDYARTGKL
jgi:hypothetical protein